MFITIILFLIGFVLITKGADIFINCTVDIGKKTNISEIILGATIVSFATTLPETYSIIICIFRWSHYNEFRKCGGVYYL